MSGYARLRLFKILSGVFALGLTLVAATAAMTATWGPNPTAHVAAEPTPPPTSVAPPSPEQLADGFVGRSGTSFRLGGQPFVFTGFNIYQANSRANCSVTMGTGSALDTALNNIGSGAEVFRAWFFQRLATTNGARDWSAFDHTIAVAKAHGVRIVATLGNQSGSCESPTSVTKYDSWYTGGYTTNVLPQNTVPYRQWVQEVVSRYRDEPTIAMWQLMNEAEDKIDGTSSCAPVSHLQAFAADVSGLVKSIDPNHLVNLGTMGSGQCGSAGSDYQTVQSIATLDVCEFHDYGHDSESMPSYLSRDISVCNALGKPIFVGEAGIKPSNVGGTLAARASMFDTKITTAFSAGVGGYLVWNYVGAGSSTTGYAIGPGDPAISVLAAHRRG